MLNDSTLVENDHLKTFNLSFLKLIRKGTNFKRCRGRRIMAITPASQAGDEGSIPFARSN